MVSPFVMTDNILIFKFINYFLTNDMLTYYQPRAIVIYTDFESNYVNYITSIISESHTSPVYIFPLNEKLRSFTIGGQDSYHLNIIIFNQPSSTWKIENIRESIGDDDQAVIIFESEESHQSLYSMISKHLKFLNRFIVLCSQNNLYIVRVHRNMEIIRYSLEQDNYPTVLRMINRLITKNVLNFHRSNITTVIKYLPPMSALTTVDTESKQIVIIGIDSLVAYDLIQHLNGTAIMKTDVAQEDSAFRGWFTYVSPYINNLYFRFYHMDAIRNVTVDDFNYT